MFPTTIRISFRNHLFELLFFIFIISSKNQNPGVSNCCGYRFQKSPTLTCHLHLHYLFMNSEPRCLLLLRESISDITALNFYSSHSLPLQETRVKMFPIMTSIGFRNDQPELLFFKHPEPRCFVLLLVSFSEITSLNIYSTHSLPLQEPTTQMF